MHPVGPETLVVLCGHELRAPLGPLSLSSAVTVLGDLDLDLSDATIRDEATLRIATLLGDVDVLVPQDWRVVSEGPQILGDVTIEPSPALPATAPILHLQLVTLAGDVEVRHVRAPAAADATVP